MHHNISLNQCSTSYRSILLNAISEYEAQDWLFLLETAAKQKPVLENCTVSRRITCEELKLNNSKFKEGAHVLLLKRHITILERESMKLIGQFMLETSEELILHLEDEFTVLIESPDEYRIALKVRVVD